VVAVHVLDRADQLATLNPRRSSMSAVATPNFPSAAKRNVRELIADIDVAPIVAAIDDTEASRGAVEEAVRLGTELDAPIVFVHVRRGPAGFFGEPFYQRRLTEKMARARRTLERAVAAAARAGVPAVGEILEGSPRRRISEFAQDRGARLVVVGSRQRKLGRSVSSGVVRSAERPVVVARGLRQLAVAR
jgi:nucleotide-binding universal stress UspA family protein